MVDVAAAPVATSNGVEGSSPADIAVPDDPEPPADAEPESPPIAEAPIVEIAPQQRALSPTPASPSQPSSSALRAALLEFAASSSVVGSPVVPNGSGEGAAVAADAGIAGSSLGTSVPLSEDLENIIREVAATGGTRDYPWDALRILLARKMELVLWDFWREAPDFPVAENTSFEAVAVEPLTRSLLETRREGPPFTIQRFCELLAEPRLLYKSTRKFLLALQRTLLVKSIEESTVASNNTNKPPPAVVNGSMNGGATANGTPHGASGVNGATADSGSAAAIAGRKRKLPPEQANGAGC